MITIFGIPNCGSVKKALAWFDAHQIPYHFHNFKKDGLNASLLDTFLASEAAPLLLNKKGTTWRQLDDDTKAQALQNSSILRTLFLQQPTLIKRPVILFDNGKVVVGLEEPLWEQFVKETANHAENRS